jgi:hypothetical protein
MKMILKMISIGVKKDVNIVLKPPEERLGMQEKARFSFFILCS